MSGCFRRTGRLSFGFGSNLERDQDHRAAILRVGRMTRDALEAEGLHVEWFDDTSTQIIVWARD